MDVRYRVGEFAELAGVSAKTLRFYDEIGLLRPASKDPRPRYRHYLPKQLQTLTSILALKDVGVPLADIRRLTQTAASKNDRRETLMDLQKTVEGSLDKARESLRWINAALAELNDCTHPVPVAVKRRPPLLVASVRSNVRSYEEIEPFKEALLGELPPESIAGPHGVLWHRCADSGSLEGEPFVALKRRVPQRSGNELKTLPAGNVCVGQSACGETRSHNP